MMLQELADTRQQVVNAIAAASRTHERLIDGDPDATSAHEAALHELHEARKLEEALWGDLRELTEPTP